MFAEQVFDTYTWYHILNNELQVENIILPLDLKKKNLIVSYLFEIVYFDRILFIFNLHAVAGVSTSEYSVFVSFYPKTS